MPKCFDSARVARRGVELPRGQRACRDAVAARRAAPRRRERAAPRRSSRSIVRGRLGGRNFGERELARREAEPRDARPMPARVDGDEQVVALGVEQVRVGDRAGRDDAHHLALDRALAGRRIADLLADRDRLAQLHQLREIALDGVERHAGHRDRRAGGCAARGERDVEELGGALRVVVEQLVEIAHPVEQQLVRMLRLRAEILLHHRRVRRRAEVGGLAAGVDIVRIIKLAPRSWPARAARAHRSEAQCGAPRPLHAMPALTLRPGALALADLRRLWSAPSIRCRSTLRQDPRSTLRRKPCGRVVAAGKTVYGVNTGFGLLARTRIDDARLAELQRALVLSHSAGTGALAGGQCRAARRRVEGGLARARAFGRALERDRGARRARKFRSRSLHPVAGIGRRVGRPGAARASVGGADRRGRSDDRWPRDAGARGARASRTEAGRAGAEGGTRAAERHAGVDGARARGPVRGRARDGGRFCRGCAER